MDPIPTLLVSSPKHKLIRSQNIFESEPDPADSSSLKRSLLTVPLLLQLLLHVSARVDAHLRQLRVFRARDLPRVVMDLYRSVLNTMKTTSHSLTFDSSPSSRLLIFVL